MAKQVDFEVRVIDADKAAQEFNKVDDKIEDIKNQSSQTIPKVNDLGSSISSTATMARNATQGITALAGIIGGAALIGGLTIAIAAFLDWKKQLDELNKRLGEFEAAANKAIGAMLKFKDPIKIKFELDTTQTETLLETAKARKKILEEGNRAILQSAFGADGMARFGDIDIGAMTAKLAESLGIWSMLSEEQQKQLKYNEGLIKAMDEQLYTLEAQKMLKQDMDKMGIRAVADEDDKTKAIKEQTKAIKEQIDVFQLFAQLYERQKYAEKMRWFGTGTKLGGKFNMESISLPEKPSLGAELTDQEFYRMNEQWIEGIYNTIDIMRNGFNEAWEDIFGEANSLFEKMIASWADVFFNAFSKTIMGGILDLIPGGSLISGFLGLDKPSTGTTVIKLQLGNKDFAEAVVSANKTAAKLRLN